ncbi:ATP-dependent zinc metalloprotease FtsH 3 [Eubacteriaceae bacterium CHKCI004]|nr:ATP-dependent zinc metalloprotease FtsH 3 [Eubacteriaceae bacterium CHKCI004]
MQTKLLESILQKAKQLQMDNKKKCLNVPCLYVAILDICKEGDSRMAGKYDQEEWKTLLQMVKKDCIEDRESLIYLINQSSDESYVKWSREFRIWLSMNRRSAVDAYKYIRKYGNISADIQSLNNKKEDSDIHSTEEQVISEPEKKDNNISIEQIVEQTVLLRETLLDKIIGQNHVVTKFADGYFEGELTSLIDEKRKGPKSVFLFAGSPGVGKTFLATEAASILKLPTIRLDMSGYADGNAAFELTGASSNFQSPQPGVLTGFVHDNPKSVIIFDEIEKTHHNVIHLFLQVLDAGFLYDSYYAKKISFLDTILIFTTNAGKQLYTDSLKQNFSDVPKQVIINALEKDINPMTGKSFFPQAICSRLASGNVFLFNHLSANDLSIIAARKLLECQENFTRKFAIESSNCEILATTLLFSLGGHCDARNLTGAIKKFFSSEIFEMFRLYDKKTLLKKINWKLDLENADVSVQELYELPDDSAFLFFGDKRLEDSAVNWRGKGNFLFTDDIDKARKIIKNHELNFIAVDYLYGSTDKKKYLNAEDVSSDGKILFEEIKKEYPELPVYIWETDLYEYNREEKVSFFNKGANDILKINFHISEKDEELIDCLMIQLQQQKALDLLKTKHQLVSFETSQELNEDGTVGEIRVFDLRISTAIEADEQKDIVSAEEKPNLHWEDIVVSQDAKEELQYFQGYLNHTKEFLKKGAKAPKGILLYGPPGTGKTSLAKVMASESDVTFLSVSADQFISKWAGEGPQSVHHIFSVARKYAPAILFIDEIDAIGRRRSGEDSHDGRQEILNALLTEMDGFKNISKKPVLVMAATNLGGNNRNTGALDPALVRRFDRSICIDLPDQAGRKKLIQILCRKNKIIQISESMMDNLAERSIGMSPALIEGAINAAIRDAIRNNGYVTDDIINEAFEKYNNGEEKHWDKTELVKTARHEAGHALLSNYYNEKPSYLTITARDNHGGYMLYGGSETKGSYTKTELLHKIAIALGGRAAELVYYGEEEGLSTGPSEDLKSAVSIAESMICRYGMFEEITLGVLSEEQISDELSKEIQMKINSILSEQLETAKNIIRAHSSLMEALVDALLKKNYLNKKEIQDILG